MPDKYRVQFDFTEDALRVLDGLKDRLHLSTRAEVVRYGLRILDWVLTELDADRKIAILGKDGKSQEVMFAFLQRNVGAKAAVSAAAERSVAR